MFGKLFGKKSREDGNANQTGMSADAFTRLCRERIREARPDLTITVTGTLTLSCLIGANAAQINLARIWEACGGDPLGGGRESFERSIAGHLESIRASEAPPVLQKEALLPVVRNRHDVAAKAHMAAGSPSRPIGTEVVGLLVFDDENSMQYLRPADMGTLGLSDDECWNIAMANLEAMEIKFEFLDEKHRVGMVTCGGDYEASHILNDALWRKVEAEWEVPPVAFIPLRDVLVFVRSDCDIEIAHYALKCLGMAQESAAPISAAPLLRSDGKWVAYDTDALSARLRSR